MSMFCVGEGEISFTYFFHISSETTAHPYFFQTVVPPPPPAPVSRVVTLGKTKKRVVTLRRTLATLLVRVIDPPSGAYRYPGLPTFPDGLKTSLWVVPPFVVYSMVRVYGDHVHADGG